MAEGGGASVSSSAESSSTPAALSILDKLKAPRQSNLTVYVPNFWVLC